MKKIAIILDSHTGRSKKQIEDLGFYFLPQIVIVDGKEYRDGIDMFLERDIDMLDQTQNTKTSMPNVGDITNLFQKLSDSYEHVVYLPMTKSISGTFSAASAVAASFPKVRVIDNNLLSDGFIYTATHLKAAVEKGESLEKALAFVNDVSAHTYSILIPGRIDGLIRSGRLKGIKKIILEKAKLLPLLQLEPAQIAVKGVKRSIEKATIAALEKIIELSGGAEQVKNYMFELIHTGGPEVIKMAERVLRAHQINNFTINWASSPVGAYLGKGSLAINAFKK